MGKYMNVGLGVSKEKDSYKAAKEAAMSAIKECKRTPNFTLVLVDSRYEPKKVLKGCNEILGNNWIGCSTDRQLNSKLGYVEEPVISVMCIYTDYMHFSISAVSNYRKNPFELGKKAIKESIGKLKIDQYLDPYVQFRRTQTKDFSDIVRNQPYFILTLLSGTYFQDKKPVMGRETEFINGIIDETGANIPIVGFVSNSDFDAFMKNAQAENFQFANGKLVKDCAIVVFAVSNLYFSHSLAHGYKPSGVCALITKMDESGHIVMEINNKNSIDEYCRIIGVNKSDFLKNPYNYTLTKSLAVLDSSGETYIKAMGTTPDGKYLFSQAKLPPTVAVAVVNYNEREAFMATVDAVNRSATRHHRKNIACVFIASCSARRALLKDKEKKLLDVMKKNIGDVPWIGFYTFGEIGSNKSETCQLNEQTVTLLTIFDSLLTE